MKERGAFRAPPMRNGDVVTKPSSKLMKMRRESESSFTKSTLQEKTATVANEVSRALREKIESMGGPSKAPETMQCRKFMLCKAASLLDEIRTALATQKPGKKLREVYGCLFGARELCDTFSESTSVLIERAHIYLGLTPRVKGARSDA